MDPSDSISYKPIGMIHSPLKTKENSPIQSSAKPNITGKIEIFPEYAPGLKDLDKFSFIFVLYHFNRIKEKKLHVIPYLDIKERGIFSTRAPPRPNPIGLSLVQILKIEGNEISINHVDILDKTPLLDIKPFIPYFDCANVKDKHIEIGWLSDKIQNQKNVSDDGRFL